MVSFCPYVCFSPGVLGYLLNHGSEDHFLLSEIEGGRYVRVFFCEGKLKVGPALGGILRRKESIGTTICSVYYLSATFSYVHSFR